ncbi:DUF2326 domain-containing protein [Paenibacillus macerans]|uniref:DUF2326 domain-containing protein n=1 Tax=Paenibacillus macerans TaxID=44252 RepID=UPI00203FB481|nr:DUF2326 domain-containing protein [Paenibacillus macerans]MCM3703343.1 DUF2326 domain-containing protein [Paenibacillus macerans]
MRIKRLLIIAPSNKVIRDIEFNEFGTSFIYGNIQEPKNERGTINSLGKTLLLKLIDYIFGANEDSTIIKDSIHGYILKATITFKGSDYFVCRVLGKSEGIQINSAPYTLSDYKAFFNIDRSKVTKQLLVYKKASEISQRGNPSKDDVVDFLDLLGMDGILDVVRKIYEAQEKIKEYKKNKTELISFYGEIDTKQIDEEIYFVDKEVQRLSDKLREISKKIKKIETSDLQTNIVEEYATKSNSLKVKKGKYENAKIEVKRLEEFISNSDKNDIPSDHVIAIFNKANIEVPEMVKREIKEVELFHNIVYKERKEFLEKKKETINKTILELEKDIYGLSNDVDNLGKIISINQVYQQSIDLYEKHNNDLQELKFKEGKLSQIKNIDSKIKTEDSNLSLFFDEALLNRENYEDTIVRYRDFIYTITKEIYDEDVNSFFDIKVREKHQIRRPISVEIHLKGDTGEGVNEVKKNLMDYLLFRYNEYLDILVHDSSCYSGIDPRQVSNMIKEVRGISNSIGKQAIIAINKYQISDDDELLKIIQSESAIILSEKDKLFGFDFD